MGCNHAFSEKDGPLEKRGGKEYPAMFAAIRYYQADPPSIDEVLRRVQEEFVPLIRDMAGFVSYFALVPSEEGRPDHYAEPLRGPTKR